MDIDLQIKMIAAMGAADVAARPYDAGYNKRWVDALALEGFELTKVPPTDYPSMMPPRPYPEGKPYTYPSQLKKVS